MKRLIDLHIHLDGSLPYETVHRLMQQAGMPPKTDEELRPLLSVPEDCRDLNEYLERFQFPLQLLQTREALETSVYELLSEQARQGLVYTEIRFAPQLHCAQGLHQAEVIEAALAGLRHYQNDTQNEAASLHAGLILCTMRGEDNHEANTETVRLAAQYLGKGVVALDLAGAEALFPTADFADLFAEARHFLFRSPSMPAKQTAHPPFGQPSPSAHSASATVSGPWRMPISWRNWRRKIPLECCPTSNLNTKMFPDMAHYPIRDLLSAGVCATVNTDNMTVSDTTEPKEYQKLEDALGLTEAEETQLLLNAAAAIFGSEEEKERLRTLILQG